MTSSSNPKVIPLRKMFPKEDKDFTPWLCKEDNLANLSEKIGIDLEFETREKKVGPYFLDILCKNIKDKSSVAIENQIEKTDHAHLGQILTYGVGLDVATMIWIAEDFTDLHRKAIKWLNKNTPEEFSFFAVKAEAKRIDSLNPVFEFVDFSIVCKPDGHRIKKNRGKQKKSKGDLSPLEVLRKRYWQGLEKHMENAGSKLTGQTPSHWQSQCFNIGRNGAAIFVKLYVGKNKIRFEIDLNERKTAKAFFHLLQKDKKAIEKEIGFELDWQELPRQVHSSIGLNIEGQNIKDEKKWAKQHEVIRLGVESFHNAFAERIRNINLSDWNPDASK